ncbi:hypothetical protein O7631_18185 [Micromonospora sp. WMMD967]|uniref:hypothetical protein n=1 Tax=Micromonospora sp. WMMD967 TaxID=3016101 RepID=UPI002417689B|nr:hypothetical protein [Micromonospora sp. WMMD967]MDG4838450.1 hypothetical protein [Micromonospora sp. WMMD967]
MPRQTRVPTSRDQVYESLRVSLRDVGVGHGPWDGAAADDAICGIADAVELDIRRRLEELDVREVLRWSAGEMARSIDLQYKARTAPGASLAAAREAQLHAENAAVGHLVCELVARQSVGGRRRVPTRRDCEALAVLAHELWRWRTVADRVAVRLVTVASARLTKQGTFGVEVRDRPPFRASRFDDAYVRRMADRDPIRGATDRAVLQALAESLKKGGELPDDLADIDSALKADRGYGLIDLFAAQEFLIEASGADDDSVTGHRFASREGLDRAVRVNAEQLLPHASPDGVVEACRHMIWTQELLQDSPLQMFEYRESTARLYSRPILELADRSLFVPRNAPGLARVVLLQRVLEGTWPEQLSSQDPTLRRALTRRRDQVRPVAGFEAELKSVLATTGLPYVAGVNPSRPGHPSEVLGVPVRAEIDAVVVAPHVRTVWVLEAKDLAVPFSARRIRSELDKYRRPGGHVDKLRAKVEDVATNPTVVAARLSMTEEVHTFIVRGLFVTREPAPAAYVDDRVHDFVTVDQLPSVLSNRLGC